MGREVSVYLYCCTIFSCRRISPLEISNGSICSANLLLRYRNPLKIPEVSRYLLFLLISPLLARAYIYYLTTMKYYMPL